MLEGGGTATQKHLWKELPGEREVSCAKLGPSLLATTEHLLVSAARYLVPVVT